MKLKSVHISIGRTINLGKYEFSRIDAGAEADIEDGEDRKEVFAKLREIVQEELAEMFDSEMEKRANGQAADDYF